MPAFLRRKHLCFPTLLKHLSFVDIPQAGATLKKTARGWPRPGHLKASNEPGRVALVCRIVSLRALAAFIATHLGAELVERHGAEHRDPLAEHLERRSHGALAALAPDPRVTLGLELGDSSVVCHLRIKARTVRERTSFRPRSFPGVPPKKGVLAELSHCVADSN
jgi:hypothetical protein